MAPFQTTQLSSERLLSTANAFIAALSSLNVDEMLALRTPDCQQVILPASLGRKPMSNDEFRTAYARYLALAQFHNYNITIHSTAVDIEQQKVVLHANGEAATLAGPFKSEYVFLLTMVTEHGTVRLSRVEEFVDSKLSAEEGGKVREAIAKVEEEGTH